MKLPALPVLLAAAAVTLTACGGGSSSSTAADGGGTTTAPASSGTGLHTATTSLGKVLVDSKGMTLYVLSADGMNHSTCNSQCLQFWPAVAPGGSGRLKATVGHTSTPDGTAIATVAGHPVYTFALDHAPGDVHGEGVNEFGGTWYAVSPTGQPVTKAGSAPSAPSSMSSSSGGRYNY